MIRLGRRGLALLAVVFVVLPIVDIWLLVAIGSRIGALPVLLFVLVEAVVGAWLIRRRWRSVWRSLQDRNAGVFDISRPDQSIAQVIDTLLVVIGGVALIFPGLITALIGLICLVPFTRRLPAALLSRSVARRMPEMGDLGQAAAGRSFNNGRRPSGYGEVIEGEVVEGGGTDSARRAGPDSPAIIRGEVDDR
jgi:UPF0716 protein FxsA